jgi:hypothetical protein
MPAPAVERTIEMPVTALPASSPSAPPVQSLSTAPTAEITLDQVPVPAVPDLEKAADSAMADLPVEKAPGFEPTAAEDSTENASSQAPGLETVAAGPSDEPPIDSFTLEGLETTAVATPPPNDEEQTSPVEASPAAAESPTDARPVDAEPSSGDLTFIDVNEAPTARAETSSGPFERTAEMVETPATEAPDAEVLQAPDAEAPMADAKPFVTETMAELYEQQGHRDEALRVYRALLGQRPNDAHIQSRIEQLEGKRGPTIRELLARMAARRPTPARPQVAFETTQPTEPATQAPEPATQAPEPAMAASERAEEPGSRRIAESPTAREDMLGQLFGNAAVAGADETAALTLSAVFSNDGRSNGSGSTTPLTGAPAHPAAKDLSLDAVFGSETPAPPAATSFSFDQFFSERATAEHPATGTRTSDEGQETKDDVAKFTQWLEGLKQR